MPAIDAVMNVAIVPPNNDRRPRRARSPRLSGAIPPMPPIIMPIEPRFANPASSPWQKCNFLNWDSRVSAKTEQR